MFELDEKKEIAEAIYEAEVTADMHGGSVGTVLLGYAESVKKLEPKKIAFSQKIKQVANRIIKGEKSERVYAPYIDREMLYILKEASEAGVRSGQIVREYLPIRKLANTIRKKILSKLQIPVIISFVALGIMYYVVGEFQGIIEDGTLEGDFDTALWVAQYYLPISITMLASVTMPLLLIPHKIPKLKEVFRKTDALVAVLLIKILNHIGQSPVKIIPFVNHTFELNIPIKSNDIEGLSRLLYFAKYISIYQASKIMNIVSLKRDFPIVLDEILNEIKLDVELSSETISEAVGNIATILIMLPLAPALYVILTVVKAILLQSGI